MLKSSLPPFPDDVVTQSLTIIDYGLLEKGDVREIDRLWDAATRMGFWYLKNHGTEEEASGMFELGKEIMDLEHEEKMKFDMGNDGATFGYKALGTNVVDPSGTRDKSEFINISKDDAIVWPKQIHRSYPEPVDKKMDIVVRPFIQKSHHVATTILDVFNGKLGMKSGTLLSLHQLENISGDEARIIKVPANIPSNAKALGEHTDFGSLSCLHNKLGGLQVLDPETNSWKYVKPLPGHVICNIGDALFILSGGILRSALHKVIAPPGVQSMYERWSLVYFSRPDDNVILNALVEKSEIVANEVTRSSNPNSFATNSTVAAWIARRVKYRRAQHFKDAQSYVQASGGTEVALLKN
ncbi:hypothetical protein BDQ17DRAFT_1305887 [Cyathus striatus]|nr:hypothetical protein BDQ17DRAFT_1305887 [Cyathus striatus]